MKKKNTNPIPLPDGIDFSKPNTITKDKIQNYYNDIKSHFGNFCGDCAFMLDSKCNKGHNPRRYDLEIGPYEFMHAKKNCKDFELEIINESEDDIRRHVSNALDCFVQQYG